MFRKILAIVSLAALLSSPAFGFDTLWHADANQKVGRDEGCPAGRLPPQSGEGSRPLRIEKHPMDIVFDRIDHQAGG